MNEYTVRMEFDTQGTDLLDIEVQADSREKAIKQALKLYHAGATEQCERYASNHFESTLSDNANEWIVESNKQALDDDAGLMEYTDDFGGIDNAEDYII